MMKRILIVDDEKLILYSLSSALRQTDTEVKAVSCANDAISAAGRIPYQLCFLDINLPDMNGLEAMKIIKQASPVTKIIIMTGGVVDPAMLKSIQENAILLMPKPFDLDRIKTFVDQILRHATAGRFTGVEYPGDTDHTAFENWLLDGLRQYEFC